MDWQRMNFLHYLPQTEKRVERLKRVIDGRPVAILLPGYSLYDLQKNITDLAGLDICYAAVNNFMPLEASILKEIDKHFTIIMCSACPDGLAPDIFNFLSRDERNFFISEKLNFKAEGGKNLIQLYTDFNEKILFFTSTPESDDKPDTAYPLHFLAQNSFSILLSITLIGEPRSIVLFGADGGKVLGNELYYMQDVYFSLAIHADGLYPSDSIARDTEWFNETMPIIVKRVKKLYNLNECKILNASPFSNLATFEKVSYAEAVEHLREVG